MADRSKIDKAQVRTDRGRDRNKVSAAVNFPKCAYVSNFSSFLFQLTHVTVLKLKFNDAVTLKVV